MLSILQIQDILEITGRAPALLVGAPPHPVVDSFSASGCNLRVLPTDPGFTHPRGLPFDPRWTLPDCFPLCLRPTVILTREFLSGPQNAVEEMLRNLDGWRDHTLVLEAWGLPRAPMENRLYRLGYASHPGGWRHGVYAQLRDDLFTTLRFYRKIEKNLRDRWSLEQLEEHRLLHTDMLRETGPRADAHVLRYVFAAHLVRQGDVVLDLACGMGYGSAVIKTLSAAQRVVGVDSSPEAVHYATDLYGAPGVEFLCRDASDTGLAPGSVHLIVCMETLEHVLDCSGLLKHFFELLTPDGRLVVSVPDDWADETGEDPNPYHHHVFTWKKLGTLLENSGYLLEKRFLQGAPGGPKNCTAREFRAVGFGETAQSEWIVAVASKDATQEARIPYRHPFLSLLQEESGSRIVDFASHYDTPWIYRQLVQIPERLEGDVLEAYARKVLALSRKDSADRGAALCVLAYHLKEKRDYAALPSLTSGIAAYLADTIGSDNPHVARWRISVCHVAGQIGLAVGDEGAARRWFRSTWDLRAEKPTPLLATKTVSAAFYLGVLDILSGNTDAGEWFRQGVLESESAVKSDWREVIGSLNNPIPAGLHELADILELGSQCAKAITFEPYRAASPQLFWSQIGMRGFGMANWSIQLQQMNEDLSRRCTAPTSGTAAKGMYDALAGMDEAALGGFLELVPGAPADTGEALARAMRRSLAPLLREITAGNPRILIYGAGLHTKVLLGIHWELAPFVTGFIDQKGTGTFLGRPVIDPTDVRAKDVDIVVYSSASFELQMYDRLKHLPVRHILLYNELPPGPEASGRSTSTHP